jgi:hypothetical protein
MREPPPLQPAWRASAMLVKAAAARIAAQRIPAVFNMTLFLRYRSFDYLFNLPIETKLL